MKNWIKENWKSALYFAICVVAFIYDMWIGGGGNPCAVFNRMIC